MTHSAICAIEVERDLVVTVNLKKAMSLCQIYSCVHIHCTYVYITYICVAFVIVWLAYSETKADTLGFVVILLCHWVIRGKSFSVTADKNTTNIPYILYKLPSIDQNLSSSIFTNLKTDQANPPTRWCRCTAYKNTGCTKYQYWDHVDNFRKYFRK